MDEIQKAYQAHASVSSHLQKVHPILRKPSTEMLHTISRSPVLGKAVASDQLVRSTTLRVLSKKSLAFEVPQQDSIELNFRRDWFEGGDHELLQRILKSGRVPLAWKESWSADNPRKISQALSTAKKRGYSVPDKFLTHNDTSYSEAEAWHAAYVLISNNFLGWNRDARKSKGFTEWRSWVCQLTGQFIVPDPLSEWKTPYVLDQLWIVATPEKKVRLIALEIDGEVHLDIDQQKRDRQRDVMLAAMGYEVYHVAGWWCRVDPYRVICEFLHASSIFPNAHQLITGHHFKAISDYICELCNQPLVRWDDNWIAEMSKDNDYLTTHQQCAHRASDLLGM